HPLASQYVRRHCVHVARCPGNAAGRDESQLRFPCLVSDVDGKPSRRRVVVMSGVGRTLHLLPLCQARVQDGLAANPKSRRNAMKKRNLKKINVRVTASRPIDATPKT